MVYGIINERKMLIPETKRLLFCAMVFLCAVLFVPKGSTAQNSSSANFKIDNAVIDAGFLSSSSSNFGLAQSLAQLAIGKSSSANFQLWSGFQYFYTVEENTLTANAADAEVDLSWTVPSTTGGMNVAGYEVGTGTVSGSYTFESVGNVTVFTKTGLTNGTQYYFIVKALSAGGTFLVFSNEATATPNGAVPPPPPSSGGGGGGTTYGNIIVSGTSFPGAAVTLLRESVIAGSTVANASGDFSFNLTGLNSGNYSFGVYAVDKDGLKTPAVGFAETISSNVTTTVSGIIIPPTLRQSHTAVKQGESIVFSGYALPSSSIAISVSGTKISKINSQTNSNGYYTYTLNTSDFPKGPYQIYVTSKKGSGPESAPSNTLGFEVGDRTETPPTGVCGRSDLNCDGKVELTDFSILLYFWDLDFSKNPRVDIDKSGNVGLRDLSIMLYDWTG